MYKHRCTKHLYLLLAIALCVLILDQFIKYLVYSQLSSMEANIYRYPYGGIGVFKNFGGIEFSINHMTNTGAAWGFLSDYQLPLVIFRVGLIVGLVIYLLFFSYSLTSQIPLTLIIAGAIGNVLDFFIYGHVVDMFHFIFWGYEFPVFNVADSMISIGVLTLFILSWYE